MKKQLLLVMAFVAGVFTANAQEWNFSDFTAGDIAETTVIDGLTIHASSGKKVSIDGSKKTFEISTRAEFVYKLSAAADADDYKRNLRYDEDLYGLQDFLDACSDARDDCTVALTKDSKGKIVRICAIAG